MKNNRPSALVRKAREMHVVRINQVTSEQIDLMLEVIRGDLTLTQAAAALASSHNGTIRKMFRFAVAAYRRGILKEVNK